MGDGWETARRRVPGNDWVILALGHPGVVETVEIDTAHFKGNYPDGVSIQAALVDMNDPAEIELDSANWQDLLPRQKLGMDAEHRFDDELRDMGKVSHLRMSIYPDGGISRLRVIGRLSR